MQATAEDLFFLRYSDIVGCPKPYAIKWDCLRSHSSTQRWQDVFDGELEWNFCLAVVVLIAPSLAAMEERSLERPLQQ